MCQSKALQMHYLLPFLILWLCIKYIDFVVVFESEVQKDASIQEKRN